MERGDLGDGQHKPKEERGTPDGTTQATANAEGELNKQENEEPITRFSSALPAADGKARLRKRGQARGREPSAAPLEGPKRPARRKARKNEGANLDLRSTGSKLAGGAKSVGVRMFQMLILVVVGLAIAAVTAFAFCWVAFPVGTTPIAGQRAIASLETVTLGGVQQTILVRAEDASNPIILLLHGGPGLPLIPFRSGFAALERDFVVVYWDQFGSGKSCEWSTFIASPSAPSAASSHHRPSPIDHHHHLYPSDENGVDENKNNDGDLADKPRRTPCRRCKARMTDDRFGVFGDDDNDDDEPKRLIDLASTLSDAEELVRYLCRRFHRTSVALVAHDSGSVPAMHLAHHHPDLIDSVFLVAPLIDFGLQQEFALEWALDKAERERHYSALNHLEQISLPLANATQLLKLRRAVADLGGDLRKGDFVLKLLHHLFSAPEYGVVDKLAFLPCGIQSAAHQFDDLKRVNLTEQVREVRGVPVTMACGRWDRLAPCAVVETYLRALRVVPFAPSPSPPAEDGATSSTPATTTPPYGGEVVKPSLVVFRQSAHWPFIEEADTFAARLREHLAVVR